jgi:heme/copper-type cytochrome/quinol oxidase subunit 4
MNILPLLIPLCAVNAVLGLLYFLPMAFVENSWPLAWLAVTMWIVNVSTIVGLLYVVHGRD